VLNSVAGDEVIAELAARGSDHAVVEMVVARGLSRAMLVGPLTLDQAQALRQAAKQAGALAVLAKPAGRADPTRAEVIVMGGMEQLAATAAKVGGEIGARMEAARAAFAAPAQRVLRCRERELALGERTLVMGIVNVTPDSFSGDGLGSDTEAAIAQGLRMVEEGADLLDIGGESTRPGSEPVSEEDELRRVVPVIEGLARQVSVPISIDSYKSAVARAGLAAGASIVNDISGLHHDLGAGFVKPADLSRGSPFDSAQGKRTPRPTMAEVIAEAGAAVVIMHIQGTPRDMQKDPKYADVIGEISDYLEEGIASAVAAGLTQEQIAVDPGIGFGKTLEHNLEILRRLREFRALGCAVMVGASRKSMIGKILDLPADQRVEGTAATVALAIAAGADIVRVHDVKEMVRVARVADAIVRVKHEAPESEYHWGEGKA
jgi:dihydropteroate synthase